VGRTWRPHEYEVGREKIREYCEAIGAEGAVHRDHEAARAAGFRAAVAPPTFAAVYVGRSVAEVMFDPSVGIFDPAAGLASYRFVQRIAEFEWAEPVCSGDAITTRTTLLEAGERDGTPFRVFSSESVNQRGELVALGRFEGVVPQAGGARGSAPDREIPPAEAAPGPLAGLEPGDPLPAHSYTPDRWAPTRYAGAGGDFTPFHLDRELARAMGFRDVILHGLYSFAILARGLAEPQGGDPRLLRRLAGRFRRPAFPEAELTSRARVSAVSAGVVEADCELLQDGKAVIVDGTATLLGESAK
jgi:acyl dehydratase